MKFITSIISKLNTQINTNFKILFFLRVLKEYFNLGNLLVVIHNEVSNASYRYIVVLQCNIKYEFAFLHYTFQLFMKKINFT